MHYLDPQYITIIVAFLWVAILIYVSRTKKRVIGETSQLSKNIGQLARLTKKQTNRQYFSTLPIGTLFIIIQEVDLPAYDLTGYFIGCDPHKLATGIYHHTGYIERDSWEIIGDIKENINLLIY